MKKTIKVSEVLAAYRIINQAKYAQLDNADKMKFLRTTLAMKDISDKFEADTNTVADKLKQSDFKDYDEHLSKVQEFEKILRNKGDISKAPIGAAEYKRFVNEEFEDFNKILNDTMKPYADKEVELDIELLSDDAFGNLMSSNSEGWTMAQVVFLQDILCSPAKKEEEKTEKKKKK